MAVQGMSAMDIDRALGITNSDPNDEPPPAKTGKSKSGGNATAKPSVKIDTQPPKAKPCSSSAPKPGPSGESRLKSLALTGPAMVIRKIARVLQDNRMKSGGKIDKKKAAKFKEMNNEDKGSQRILKKILNIIFVTTGMSLFISVVIVIIYTSIVPTCPPIICPPSEGTPGSTPEDLMRLQDRMKNQHLGSMEITTQITDADYSSSWLQDWLTTENPDLSDEAYDYNDVYGYRDSSQVKELWRKRRHKLRHAKHKDGRRMLDT